MCKCTPEIRTPYCGIGDCQWPVSPENDPHAIVPQQISLVAPEQPQHDGTIWVHASATELKVMANDKEKGIVPILLIRKVESVFEWQFFVGLYIDQQTSRLVSNAIAQFCAGTLTP